MGFNPNGLNAPLSTDGVNLGTVTNNGFQAGNQNWAQNNISAAQKNAGERGDRWLEGLISDGISGIQGGIGFVERTLNDLTGEYFTGAGNAIRGSKFGKEWPFLSNLIASPIDIVTGGIKMGIETITTPMQLAAYTGEFWRGERELRMGDGISTLLSGVMYPAGQMLNYGRSLAGETIASALGVAKSAIEIPIKTAIALGLTSYEAITATVAWGWNQTFGDGTKSWGDYFDNDSVASSWGSVGESFENLGGFLAHPFMVAGNPIFGGNVVDKSILSKESAALFASFGYGDVFGLTAGADKYFTQDEVAKLQTELMERNGIPGGVMDTSKLTEMGLDELLFKDSKTGLDSTLIETFDADGNRVMVYSFGGTDPKPPQSFWESVKTGDILRGDIMTDFYQAIGLPSDQYQLALKNADAIQKALKKKYPDENVKFMVTGHSLGGGLAANISKELGIQGITFNPAGVNPMTTVGNRLDGFFNDPIHALTNVWNGIGHTSYNQIDSYVTSTDVLTLAQSPVFPLIGNDGRPNVEYMPTFSANSILPAHFHSNFLTNYFPEFESIVEEILHPKNTDGGK